MAYVLPFAALSLGAAAVSVEKRLSHAQECCFSISASGGVSGTVGQLSDGQNRIGGGYSPATFCSNNGQLTDYKGRGCYLTGETKQWQCDAGKPGMSGFSCFGNYLTYNGDNHFYACPVNDYGEYNIYKQPLAGQLKCVEVYLSCGNSKGGNNCGTISSKSPSPSSTTVQPCKASETPKNGQCVVKCEWSGYGNEKCHSACNGAKAKRAAMTTADGADVTTKMITHSPTTCPPCETKKNGDETCSYVCQKKTSSSSHKTSSSSSPKKTSSSKATTSSKKTSSSSEHKPTSSSKSSTKSMGCRPCSMSYPHHSSTPGCPPCKESPSTPTPSPSPSPPPCPKENCCDEGCTTCEETCKVVVPVVKPIPPPPPPAPPACPKENCCDDACIKCDSSCAVVVPFVSPAPAPTASVPGTCGPKGECGPYNGGYTCEGSPFGGCCSKYGWCGKAFEHCGAGCIAGYGKCNAPCKRGEPGCNTAEKRDSDDNEASTVACKRGDPNCGKPMPPPPPPPCPKEKCCDDACSKCDDSCIAPAPLPPPAPPAPPKCSTDGRCGTESAQTCAGQSIFGACCSKYGFCGNTWEHCNAGCQPGWGDCTPKPVPPPAPPAPPAPKPCPPQNCCDKACVKCEVTCYRSVVRRAIDQIENVLGI